MPLPTIDENSTNAEVIGALAQAVVRIEERAPELGLPAEVQAEVDMRLHRIADELLKIIKRLWG